MLFGSYITTPPPFSVLCKKRELAESARSVRVYRDEIETLKVQSSRVEKLEADVMKYRQKAEDTEYLKKRIAVSESCACEK